MASFAHSVTPPPLNHTAPLLTHPLPLLGQLGVLEGQTVLAHPEPGRPPQRRPSHGELPRRPRPLGQLDPVVRLGAFEGAQLERRASNLIESHETRQEDTTRQGKV